MGPAAQLPPEHRTITVDFRSEATYFQVLGDGTAFLAGGRAFILSRGFQRQHQATCRGGGCLTRHSQDVRVRLGGLPIWRLQCTACCAGFTVLPHVVWRARQMRPEVARDALRATHGGWSLALCAGIAQLSPMARSRLLCAFGHQRLVAVLTRGRLPLPTDVLADAKHRRGLAEHVSLPTIVSGRVLWPLGSTADARAAALPQSYSEFQRAASQQEPSFRVRGILTDGFDSPLKSLRTLFPGAHLGNCRRHALMKLPKTLAAIASPVRQAGRAPCHTLRSRARQRKSGRVFARGQR